MHGSVSVQSASPAQFAQWSELHEGVKTTGLPVRDCSSWSLEPGALAWYFKRRSAAPAMVEVLAMKAAFVLVKCDLGKMSQVANQIAELEGVSEVHSITGPYDLLVKLYAPSYEDVGNLVPDLLHKVPGVRETETLLAFQAFKQA